MKQLKQYYNQYFNKGLMQFMFVFMVMIMIICTNRQATCPEYSYLDSSETSSKEEQVETSNIHIVTEQVMTNSCNQEIITEIINPDVPDEVWIIDEEENLKNKNISVFAYESQNGITQDPSYSVTWAEGTYIDTETGIRRNSQGDYLCAMGTVFGYCGDRFKIYMLMTNGSEEFFTVQIGDSKGDRWYHPYAQGTEMEGCCIIEFIVDEDMVSEYVNNMGSYHFTDKFNGEIVKIEKLKS